MKSKFDQILFHSMFLTRRKMSILFQFPREFGRCVTIRYNYLCFIEYEWCEARFVDSSRQKPPVTHVEKSQNFVSSKTRLKIQSIYNLFFVFKFVIHVECMEKNHKHCVTDRRHDVGFPRVDDRFVWGRVS